GVPVGICEQYVDTEFGQCPAYQPRDRVGAQQQYPLRLGIGYSETQAQRLGREAGQQHGHDDHHEHQRYQVVGTFEPDVLQPDSEQRRHRSSDYAARTDPGDEQSLVGAEPRADAAEEDVEWPDHQHDQRHEEEGGPRHDSQERRQFAVGIHGYEQQ